MFGIFKSKPYFDQEIGRFERVRGVWRGATELPPHGKLDLLLTGSNKFPDPPAVLAARDLSSNYERCRAALADALIDHYRPCIEVRDEVVAIEGSFPEIASPDEVWPHVYPQYILVEGKEATPTVEIALRVAWDPEHTLGARLLGPEFRELCGSIRALVS